MIALFGVRDNQFIIQHTTTLLGDYFDPSLLHDLTTELNVKVIGSSNDGIRYTFLLERGQSEFLIEGKVGHTSMHQRLDLFIKTTGAVDGLTKIPNQSIPDVFLWMKQKSISR